MLCTRFPVPLLAFRAGMLCNCALAFYQENWMYTKICLDQVMSLGSVTLAFDHLRQQRVVTKTVCF